MTDGETAVGGGIACAKAGAAEGLPHDDAAFQQVGGDARLGQGQVGRLAAGVHAEGKAAVARGMAAHHVGHHAQVVIGAAGAARYNPLIHVEVALRVQLVHKGRHVKVRELLLNFLINTLKQFLGIL